MVKGIAYLITTNFSILTSVCSLIPMLPNLIVSLSTLPFLPIDLYSGVDNEYRWLDVGSGDLFSGVLGAPSFVH